MMPASQPCSGPCSFRSWCPGAQEASLGQRRKQSGRFNDRQSSSLWDCQPLWIEEDGVDRLVSQGRVGAEPLGHPGQNQNWTWSLASASTVGRTSRPGQGKLPCVARGALPDHPSCPVETQSKSLGGRAGGGGRGNVSFNGEIDRRGGCIPWSWIPRVLRTRPGSCPSASPALATWRPRSPSPQTGHSQGP